MRKEMADRWLGFERETVRRWLQGVVLGRADVGYAGRRCRTTRPGGEELALGILVATGRKLARREDPGRNR